MCWVAIGVVQNGEAVRYVIQVFLDGEPVRG
jgi:hypothetical protein